MDPVQSPTNNPTQDINDKNDPSSPGSNNNDSPLSSPKQELSSDEARLTKIKEELKQLQEESSPPSADNNLSDNAPKDDSDKSDKLDNAIDVVKPGSISEPPEGSSLDEPKGTQEKTKEAPSNDATEDQNKSSKDGINFLPKVLLVLGPFIMVGLFGFSLYNLSKPSGIPTQAPAEPANPKEEARKILLSVPKNPDSVSVTCLSTGETIISEEPTSCPDPQLTWSGEQPQEPETKIVGYYVYFGTNGNDEPIAHPSLPGQFKRVVKPFYDGQFQEGNTFSPKNLQQGTTYYLAVAAKSDSKNPNWSIGFDVTDLEKLEARIAKILFVYKYQ